VRTVRRVKATADTCPEVLLARYADPEDLARALIDGDPELDRRAVGRPTGPCDRMYLDADGAPCHTPTLTEVRYGADGIERERRPVAARSANLVPLAAPVWSGVLVPRVALVRRVVLARAYQVVHAACPTGASSTGASTARPSAWCCISPAATSPCRRPCHDDPRHTLAALRSRPTGPRRVAARCPPLRHTTSAAAR
jgi:hypothetical protein